MTQSFFLILCHFDEGEIFSRSSTKIGFSLRSYLRRFLLRRNDKLYRNCIKKLCVFATLREIYPLERLIAMHLHNAIHKGIFLADIKELNRFLIIIIPLICGRLKTNLCVDALRCVSTE